MSGNDIGIKAVTLPLAANQILELGYVGQSFLITDLAGSVRFAPNDQEWSDGGVGHGFNGYGFNKLRFEETAGAAASVTFIFGKGNVDFRQLILSGSIVSKSGDSLDMFAETVPDDAATLVSSLSTTKNSVEIFNNDATETIYVGYDDGVDETSGRPVGPQSSFSLDTGAALYVYQNSGGNVDVRITEIYD